MKLGQMLKGRMTSDLEIEIEKSDKETVINEGLIGLTLNIRAEEPDANGRIYSKEMIEKALKSVKKGTPILTSEGEYIGKVVSEPEIDYYAGAPRFVWFTVKTLINDFTKLNDAEIELDLKQEKLI